MYGGVQHMLCCVVYLLVFVLCLVYGGVQHMLCCVFLFACLRLVSYVWWCPTHVVLCCLFACLRLVSCVWWCPTNVVLCCLFSCLRLVYGGVQHMLCCVLCLACLRIVSCVPNVASSSGLSIVDCPFGFSNVYCKHKLCVFLLNLEKRLILVCNK